MKRGQKILKIVGIVFSIILETLAILLACSTRWMFRTWTNLSMDELVYHLTAPLEGTNTDMIQDYCGKCAVPVARDLRQISAALKMITDMERIGDQASDIAEIIITEDKSEAQDIPMIIKMSEVASKMVRDSVNAYVEKDLDLARKVMENDDVVDELFEEVKTTLINFIAENKGLQGVEAIDLIMVAKYLERIADHATNIAEWVEFSITGIHKSSVV